MSVKKWTSDQWDAYKGDGCTGIPDIYLESPCDRHDRHYATHQHRDGRSITRFEADVELAKDAWKALPVVPAKPDWTLFGAPLTVLRIVARAIAKPVVPVVVFIGVRIGGASHWEEP